jgi:hypothetical protein
MKDTEYNNLLQFKYMGGGLIPHNEKAQELCMYAKKNSILEFKEATQRDVSFHRCYMSLLGYIYDFMPAGFKDTVPKQNFYIFLKHLKGQYKVIFEFKDGTKYVEYESISFGRMSQLKFKEYINEQLPYIYENVIGAFYEGDMKDGIIENIENTYERFFQNLF